MCSLNLYKLVNLAFSLDFHIFIFSLFLDIYVSSIQIDGWLNAFMLHFKLIPEMAAVGLQWIQLWPFRFDQR